MDFLYESIRQCSVYAGDFATGGVIGPIALALGGLMAGLFHCSFMCGPVLLAATDTPKESDSFTRQLFAFHLGKLITYIALALIFSLAADILMAWLPERNLLIAPVLGLAALLVATSLWPRLSKILPLQDAIIRSGLGKLAAPFMRFALKPAFGQSALPPRSFLLGLASGLMPCGLTLAVLLSVALTADPTRAVIMMAAFGIGTSAGLTVTRLGFGRLAHKYPTLHPRNPGVQLISALWLVLIASISLA